MEFVAGAAVASVVGYQGYSYIRSHSATTVNCWFCNENSRVQYKLRNSFVCPHCNQYNGFKEDGDYNKNLGTNKGAPKTFCINAQRPPDVVERTNGLCHTCNAYQALIIEKLAEFEPVNEDKWDDEYEVFKYRLDKLYPLCGDCTIITHQKLQGDKRIYGHLLELRNKLFPAVTGALQTVGTMASKMVRRHRRQFFAGGTTTETSHWGTLGLSLILFLAQLNYLQEDADVVLLPFPSLAIKLFPFAVQFSLQISLCSLLLHFVAMANNKRRTTLPDLLFPILGFSHVVSFAFCEDTFREDLAVCRVAISAFLSVLSAAVTFIPRKKLHKKKPNKIMSSAFSVASTPASQCSSQDEFSFVSPHPKDLSPHQNDDCRSERSGATSRVTKQTIRNRLQWREREMSPEIEERTPRGRRPFIREQSPEEMDWEPTPAPSIVSISSRMGREATPARELAPTLSSLSLTNQNRTPFGVTFRPTTPSSDFPSFAHDLATPTMQAPFSSRASNFGGARSLASGFTSVSRRQGSANRSPQPAPSVFTSVSQQAVVASPLTMCVIISFVVVSLLGNIAFIYMYFQKKDLYPASSWSNAPLPCPFVEQHNARCAVVIKPTRGFFQSYRIGDDLHVGISDSQSTVHSYWNDGVTAETSSWDKSILIYQFNNDETNWLDQSLFSFIGQQSQRFLPQSYNEIEWNCFDFVLDFLRFINCRNYTKVDFVTEFVQDSLKRAMRYCTLVNKVEERGSILIG